jgi:ubiquinone/menaquinone biosynthesis C-methylase UbiE
MSEGISDFYDDLAASYHLMFEDWNRSIALQASVLGPLLERYTGKTSAYVLDCACGIGTQVLGLAQRGHTLVGSDLSRQAIERAKKEGQLRGLDIPFHVGDMRDLKTVAESGFDAVLVGDNALPHLLTYTDLRQALLKIRSKLNDSGILLATIRDYDALLLTRPSIQPPSFFAENGKRFVHQVWQWEGDQYVLHVYITLQTGDGWQVKHFVSRYRALSRTELNETLRDAGFTSVEWLEPEATSFYQPIVVAKKATRR